MAFKDANDPPATLVRWLRLASTSGLPLMPADVTNTSPSNVVT